MVVMQSLNQPLTKRLLESALRHYQLQADSKMSSFHAIGDLLLSQTKQMLSVDGMPQGLDKVDALLFIDKEFF